MMEAVSVTEELEAHPLINNMKEREKNNFKNPRLLKFGENIKYSGHSQILCKVQ